MNKLQGLTVLLVCVLLVGLFSACSVATEKPKTPITHMTPYFVTSIRPSTFTYPTDDRKVNLLTNSTTAIEFGEDFRTMTLWLDRGTTVESVTFIVTAFAQKNNNITATVQRIYRGELLLFTISSNADAITFRALSTFVLWVGTEAGHEQVTVKRGAVVATFARVTPSYIGG